MWRLIKDWGVDGLNISKGISFKELPKEGILSKIPLEYFEEYTPVALAKKTRNKPKKTKKDRK
jgi:hypothetical protein